MARGAVAAAASGATSFCSQEESTKATRAIVAGFSGIVLSSEAEAKFFTMSDSALRVRADVLFAGNAKVECLLFTVVTGAGIIGVWFEKVLCYLMHHSSLI